MGKKGKMNRQLIALVIISCLATGCMPPLLQCVLDFAGWEQTYTFEFSKHELKKRIVDTYTYDDILLKQNLGSTIIEEVGINEQYRQSTSVWMDRDDWNKLKHEIRASTPDTLNVIIGKHHSWRQITAMVVLGGDDRQSFMNFSDVKYQRRRKCDNNKNIVAVRVKNVIDRKLIEEIKS